MYSVYLGEVLLPVTPSKLTLKIKGQNKTLDLISGQQINLLKNPALSEISLEVMLPHERYPFVNGELQSIDYYLSYLETLIITKKHFQYIVSRVTPAGTPLYDTSSMTVSLEEYSIIDDAENGMDVTVKLDLKQWREYGTKTAQLVQPATATEKAQVTIETQRDTSSAPQVKTYTVVSGDCLWNIAKKLLGDGARYPEIYELNKDKIKNPNLIQPGQVLTLP